ncbi:ribbon-helix-helix protein, CopG family [Salinarimonas ramus]|uniref:Ribbon-helix-helix protein CopG domain-containing protein n=1 Tax=Salinarimonas ramus TaxID=690164 RepID=A0A917Q6A6_9HYPH|nr:ribbon-helix-helix protein, CopG family [Salinarimonas ramus]GGK29569.1 hypothetical protein GCM10011322_14960 [Salinarimonas ramus]
MNDPATGKRRRGPAPTEVGTLVGVRLRSDLLGALDALIANEPDPKPSRAEIIRRVLRERLE